jgi:hypothetical protein
MNHKFRPAHIFLLSSIFLAGCGGQGGSPSSSEAVVPAPPETAEATVRFVADGLLQHEPQRVWAALPASYQQDVSGMIAEVAEKVDPEIYDRGFSLLERLGQVLESKRDLFLDSQLFPDAIDRLEASTHWGAMTELLQMLATSEIASIETLSNLNMERFLSGTGAGVMAKLEGMAALAGEDLFESLRGLQVEVLSSAADQASLKVLGTGFAESWEMIRVEDRWIPADLAADWPSMMAEAREQMASFSPAALAEMKPQIMGAFGMVEGTLSQLQGAQTVEQLDQALQGAIFSVMGMMMGAAMQGMDLDSLMPSVPSVPSMPSIPSYRP